MDAQMEARKHEKTCDPLVKSLVEEMIKEHTNDERDTALIVLNSFDCEKDDIEDFMS